MSRADWIDAVGSLGTSSVRRGDSAGLPKPSGGGSFSYGFNSIDATPGVVARYSILTGTAPTASGGSISAALQRSAASVAPTGFAPFLFFCMNGSDLATAKAYLLGLGDGDPSHIVLRKGLVSGGLPDVPVGQSGVLRQSTDSFAAGSFLHLKLEVAVNVSGDVAINCYASDLGSRLVTAPSWSAIAGMPQFIDDALGVNSGSLPLLAGRFGYGFASSATGRIAYIDHIEPTLQT